MEKGGKGRGKRTIVPPSASSSTSTPSNSHRPRVKGGENGERKEELEMAREDETDGRIGRC